MVMNLAVTGDANNFSYDYEAMMKQHREYDKILESGGTIAWKNHTGQPVVEFTNNSDLVEDSTGEVLDEDSFNNYFEEEMHDASSQGSEIQEVEEDQMLQNLWSVDQVQSEVN